MIIFTVTNDLTYDARMHRICGALAANGYATLLVGRVLPQSIPLEVKPFGQKRLRCFFKKGLPFYAEYNLRLFVFLLFTRCDAVCSIDLDTLPAGCAATLLRRKKRVFDAHEYFTEVPELVGRPLVKTFWEMVARICLPFYKHAYTVGPGLAEIFERKYGLKFGVVRNVPRRQATAPSDRLALDKGGPPILLYQGALNESRGIEQTIEAMQHLEHVQLWLAGEGDLSEKLRLMAFELGVEHKVKFLGYVKPDDLTDLTSQAWLGLNVLENRGLSYYYSLANKFFAYIQAGVPQLTMDFPEYRALNAQHEVALLLDELSPEKVVTAVNNLLTDKDLYGHLQKNCRQAGEEWNWEKEQENLLGIWSDVFKK